MTDGDRRYERPAPEILSLAECLKMATDGCLDIDCPGWKQAPTGHWMKHWHKRT